jgi:hypothetical protein
VLAGDRLGQRAGCRTVPPKRKIDARKSNGRTPRQHRKHARRSHDLAPDGPRRDEARPRRESGSLLFSRALAHCSCTHQLCACAPVRVCYERGFSESCWRTSHVLPTKRRKAMTSSSLCSADSIRRFRSAHKCTGSASAVDGAVWHSDIGVTVSVSAATDGAARSRSFERLGA